MELHFTEKNIQELENVYRLNLINSLTGYKSANLIGTKNENNSNLCIVSSVIHLGSNPAVFGFIMRPNTVPRHTYSNIKKNGSFTVNQIHKNISGKAHFTSAKFPHEESEFEGVQLTETYLNNFPAPFVKESKIKIGLTFKEEHELSNGCILIVGSVKEIFVEKSAVKENGRIYLPAIDTVAISGLNEYYTGDFLEEHPYARIEEVKKNLQKPKKERPDNVVFDEDSNKYTAALKQYSTNVGAPAIQHNDLSNWKNVGSNKVNHHLQTKFNSVKKQYEEILELYEWNQKIYACKFDFEPITGQNYHLYEKDSGEYFLSQIAPHEWKKKHVGSFHLNTDRIFEKTIENNNSEIHLTLNRP